MIKIGITGLSECAVRLCELLEPCFVAVNIFTLHRIRESKIKWSPFSFLLSATMFSLGYIQVCVPLMLLLRSMLWTLQTIEWTRSVVIPCLSALSSNLNRYLSNGLGW